MEGPLEGGGLVEAPPEGGARCSAPGRGKAGGRAANRRAQAAMCVCGEVLCFRPPAGLADGLALKSLRFPAKRDLPQQMGPPLRFRGLGVRRTVADWVGGSVLAFGPAKQTCTRSSGKNLSHPVSPPSPYVLSDHVIGGLSPSGPTLERVNFALDVVDSASAERLALVALDRDGARAPGSPSASWPTAPPAWPAPWPARGVGRGDVVMTLIGNRPEWVVRDGRVLPDRRGRTAVGPSSCAPRTCGPASTWWEPRGRRGRPAQPRDDRRGAGFAGEVLTVPDEDAVRAPPPLRRSIWTRGEPALITFTSGTSGEPKPIRHGQRYLAGQRVQAEHWFGARPGDLCWCTAASGWSKSAAQRVHRTVDPRRRGAAPGRALRPRGAAAHGRGPRA